MSPLVSLLMSLSGNAVGGAVSRGTKSIAHIVIAGVLLLTAYFVGVAAFAVYLAEHMSLWIALAVLAGSLVVAAGAALLIGSWRSKAEEARAKQLAATAQDATLKALTDLGADGSPRSLLVAAVVGLVAGSLLDAKRR